MSMNERDPITEWEHAIMSRVAAWGFACILMVLVGCLVAPIFGPMIKRWKTHYYAVHDDCEQRAEAEMPVIRVWLWILAAIAWAFVIWCNLHGYLTS